MSNHNRLGFVWLWALLTGALVGLLIIASCGGGGDSPSRTTDSTPSNPSIPSGPPPPACKLGSGGPITLSTPIESRSSGVAPLHVQFDASGTFTTPATPRPFHDLEYRWHFGEVTAATWGQGSRAGVSSRTTANGPIAAHVYETPGTYTACVTVTDGTNTVDGAITITVQDPDVVFSGTNTICFSNTSNFTGCPAGAQLVPNSNDFVAVVALAGKGKRLLLERGGTWTALTPAVLTQNGPGIISAFPIGGAGAKPVIQANNDNILHVSTGITPTSVNDWRIMDLRFDGLGSPSTNGIDAKGTIKQLTLLRMDFTRMIVGVSLAAATLDTANAIPATSGHTIWDQVAIVDSTFTQPVNGNGYGMFVAAERMAILGNFVDNNHVGTHTSRHEYAAKSVISNNTYLNPTNSGHTIKLHAPGIGSTGVAANGIGAGLSRWVVISDNKLTNVDQAFNLVISPQNNSVNEQVRDVVVERNWLTSGANTQIGILVSAAEVTLRDNVIDMSHSAPATVDRRCISIAREPSGQEPAPDQIRVYNNSCGFFGTFAATQTFYWLDFPNNGAVPTNITVVNNVGYAPQATAPMAVKFVNNAVGAAPKMSKNSTDSQIVNNNPFTSSSPTVPANFAAANYAVGSGDVVPVFSDFFLKPLGAARDMGAVCSASTCP